MPPIFKGINPFKWGSEFRQYVYGNDETLKRVHSCQESRSSKIIKDAELIVNKKKCCDCVFPPHHHQTDCPLYKKPCPIHGSPFHKFEDFPVTISFYPSKKTDKLFEPVKSVLANNPGKVKLKYYFPGTGSDTEIFKKPLISGPPGELTKHGRKSSSADYLKYEGFARKNCSSLLDVSNKNKKRNVRGYISPERLRKSNFVTVTQEEPSGVSHEIFELNYEKPSDEIKPRIKGDRIFYYTANEPNPSKGTNTEISYHKNNVENLQKPEDVKKSCFCGRSYSFQKRSNCYLDEIDAEETVDSDRSVYFTPYMIVHKEEDFLKKTGGKADSIKKSKNFVSRDIIKPCCSCWELPQLEPPAMRPPVIQKVYADPKIKVNFRFKATPEKEVQVTARKNLVQVVLPSKSTDKNTIQEPLQGDKKEKEDGSDVSSEASAEYEKPYKPKKESVETMQQTSAPIMHETRETQTFDFPFETRKKPQVVIRFEDTENDYLPEMTEKSSSRPTHVQCPVCAGKNLSRHKPGTSKSPNVEFHRADRNVKKPPVKSSAHPMSVARPKKRTSRIANEVSRMNLENFQIKKKQEWENEFSRFTGCENSDSSRLESEAPTTDECSTSGNQILIKVPGAGKENSEDMPPLLNCKPCQGYQVYLSQAAATSNDLNLFPFYSPKMEMLPVGNSKIEKSVQGKSEAEPSEDFDTAYGSLSPVSDFNDLMTYINEKFTHEKAETEENASGLKNASLPVKSMSHGEKETNFIDISEYRQVCQKIRKVNSFVQPIVSIGTEEFNFNKEETDSTQLFQNSMEGISSITDEISTEPGPDPDLQSCIVNEKLFSNIEEDQEKGKADKCTVTSDIEDITLNEKILIYKDKTTHKWKLDDKI